MGRYLDWLEIQDKEFITELCGNNIPQKRFKDYRFKPVTLQELQKLDEEYIFGKAEPTQS